MNIEADQIKYFSIIGAQRSGTTYLYKMLAQHPEIKMNKSVKPEPKFFLNDDNSTFSAAEYLSTYFEGPFDTAMKFGEKSTSYLEFAHVAKKIKNFFPNGKILVILRNPVDRAISNYAFSRANNLDIRLPEIALSIENENQLKVPNHISVSPFSYVSRGIYINFIQPYLDVFHANMKVILFEDLVGNLQNVQSVFNFLGVSDSFVPKDYKVKENASPPAKVSDKLRKELSEFFIPWNKRLASNLKISLDAWR